MARAKVFKAFRQSPTEAEQRERLLHRLAHLCAHVQANTLTEDDHKLLARLGPETQRLVGYTPRVSLS
jgi:hypothetical protein